MIKILRFIKKKGSRVYKFSGPNSSVLPGHDFRPYVNLEYVNDNAQVRHSGVRIVKRDFSGFGHKHVCIKEFPNGNRLMTRITEDYFEPKPKKGGRG